MEKFYINFVYHYTIHLQHNECGWYFIIISDSKDPQIDSWVGLMSNRCRADDFSICDATYIAVLECGDIKWMDLQHRAAVMQNMSDFSWPNQELQQISDRLIKQILYFRYDVLYKEIMPKSFIKRILK